MKRRILGVCIALASGGILLGAAAAPASAMRPECRAHLETAKWCYDNGYDDWGDLEYYAYLDCEKRG
jgi:hypothetical protein